MWGRAYWYVCLLVSIVLLGNAVNYAQPQGIFNPCTILPSSTVFGCVKPDGTTITNTTGAISVTYGTGAATAAQGNDARFGLKSKVVSTTYDLTTASGTQAITGFGFVPTSCQIHALINATAQFSIGTVDSSRTGFSIQAFAAGGVVVYNLTPIRLFSDLTGANFQVGVINSYDADGLTIGWTKTAAPSGTAQLNLNCER